MGMWTYERFRNEVKKNLMQMKSVFTIDVSNTTTENALEVVKWAKKDGFKAELHNGYVEISVF